MRHTIGRIVAGLTVTMALLLSACSDQPTEVPPGSEVAAPGGASLVDPVGSCPASSIESQIRALAPPGGLRNSLLSRFKSIPSKVGQRTGTAARDKIFGLVDAILDAYYAGQFGGTSAAIQAKVLTLISSLYCFVRLDSPTLPVGSLGEDGVVGVVTPNSPTTTLAVPSAHAAVTIPAGAAPVPTTIVIHILPDDPGPLLTSLDQYPFFYEFSAFPDVTFNLDLLAGICPRDNLDAIDANLRLAHNVGPNFGDVEVLPRPAGAVPGLNCTDLAEEGPSFLRSSSRPVLDAGDGWSSMRRALAPLVSALLPEPLHAATLLLATKGVGGTTRKFSPFGIVDIFSNPGSFAPVGPTESEVEPGSTVTRTVLVASDNGAPVANVPVTFATEDGTLAEESSQITVLSDENGNASVSWTLPSEPGVYTLDASVPQEDNPPLETTDPPAGNVASFPDVAFDPQSLTFTATALVDVTINFDLAPDATPIASGTAVNTIYTSQGVTFQRAGPGTLCGPDIYANDDHPGGGFGSLPNVVSTCTEGTASDISANGFGRIRADFAAAANSACIEVQPVEEGYFARIEALDGDGESLGSSTSSPGVVETLCISATGIRAVLFSGDGDNFARFDNLSVDFGAPPVID